jgi:hypothetical protein
MVIDRKSSQWIALVVSAVIGGSAWAAEVISSADCPEGSCRANPVLDGKITQDILQALQQSAKNQQASSTNYVGSYDDVQNFVGFVDLNPQSDTYKGVMKVDGGRDTVYDTRTPSRQLDETFLTKANSSKPGRLDETAVRAKIKQIEDSYKDSFISYCNQKAQKEKSKGKDAATSDLICDTMWLNRESTYKEHKFVKDWKKQKLTIARGIAIKKLNDALELSRRMADVNLRDPKNTNSAQAHTLYSKLFDGLAIQMAILDFDPKEATNIMGEAKNISNLEKSLTIRSDRREAGNLLAAPGSASIFLSPQKLELMKRNGQDTSKLDPVSSGLWRKPEWDVSECDVTTYNRATEAAVGASMLKPEEIVDIEFKEVPDSAGTTPKVTGKVGNREYKVKVLVPIDGPRSTAGILNARARASAAGSEVRTENVVNPIASCVGYTVDPTYFKKTARLFLDSGPKAGESQEQYRARFEKNRQGLIVDMKREDFGTAAKTSARTARRYEEAFGRIEYDSNGRGYLLVNELSLEMKSGADTGIKVGLGTKEELGRSEMRQYRATAILAALFQDNDSKAKNSYISMIPSSNGDVAVGHSLSDMGSALGGTLVGKGLVNDYSPNLVSGSANGVITTNFRTIYFQPTYGLVTADDARWVMRRVAQLTPEQILKIFENAGSDPAEAQLYADKFLRRRDQLVKALFPEADRKFVADKSGAVGVLVATTSKMEDPKTYSIPGFVESGRLVKLKEPRMGSALVTGPQTLDQQLIDVWKDNAQAIGVNQISESVQRLNLGNFIFSGQRVDPATGEVVRSSVRGAIHACIPARYSVPNRGPDKESNPWMILDVYHLGPGLTTRPSPREDQSEEDLSIGWVKEVIIMRPSKTPNNDIKGRLAMFKDTCNPASLEKNMDKSAIDSLRPGDKMMVNKYRFLGGGVRLGTNGPNASLLQEAIGPEAFAEFGMKGQLFDSALFSKTADNKVEAAWSNGSSSEKIAQAGVSFMAIRFPLAGVSSGKNSIQKRIYEFDLSDAKQANLLGSSLEVSLPKDVSEGMNARESLDKDVQGRYGLLSLFGLREKRFGSEKISGHYENSSGVSRDVIAARKTTSTASLSTLQSIDKVFEATMIDDLSKDNKDSLALQVRVEFGSEYSTNKDWGKIQKGLLTLFPAQAFAGNSPSTVDPSLGSLKLKGSITFTQDALAAAFGSGVTADQACEAFESSLRGTNGAVVKYSPDSLCRQLYKKDSRGQLLFRSMLDIENAPLSAAKDGKYSVEATRDLRSNLRAVLSFRENFVKAQAAYATLAKAQNRTKLTERELATPSSTKIQVEQAARETVSVLVKMLNDNPSPPLVLDTLAKMSPKQSLCRHAVASSDEGFQNQEGELIYTDAACNKILAKTMTADQALKDVNAEDYRMIEPFAFDYFRRVGRRNDGFIRSRVR